MDIKNLIKRQDVQKHIQIITSHMLKHWADVGDGPKYVLIGRNAFYDLQDIESYIAEKAITPNLEARRKRKVIGEILEGSPTKRRPGRPKKQPTQATA
jgi:hypothetical protein